MLPIIMLVPVDKWIVHQFCERKGELELTTFSEPLTGLREIARRKPDLVFLNIEMNSTNGLDIAHALPPESCLILRQPMHSMHWMASTSMPWISCINPLLMNDLKKLLRKRLSLLKHVSIKYRKTS